MGGHILPSPRELVRFFASSDEAIVVRDLSERIVFGDAGAGAVYGYRSEEAVGRDSSVQLHTRFPERVEAIVESLEAADRWEWELEQRAGGGHKLTIRGGRQPYATAAASPRCSR